MGGRPDLAVWGVFGVWPAAALVGAALSWPPGSAAALMFALPAVWVGARFPPVEAGLFAALAGFACCTEATLLRVVRKAGAYFEVGLPGPADDRLLGPLAGLVVIGLVYRAVRDRPVGLTLAAPRSGSRDRDAAPDVLEGAVSLLSLRGLELSPPDGAPAAGATAPSPYGPAVAARAEPDPADAAVRSIRSTARACLRCEHVSVWLWDGKSLREAGSPSLGNARRPVPDPNRGLAGWALRNRRPVARQTLNLWTPRDRTLAAALAEDPAPPAGVAPLLCGPAGEGGDPADAMLHGLLIADGPRTADPQFPAVLAVLARVAATALENARRYDRVQGRARRDGLTGLLRREPLLEDLSALLLADRPDGPGWPVAAVMGDLDYFKAFNDEHGHAAGDAAIRAAADVWRDLLPPGGRVCRYGGEEFLAALPGLDAAAAADHAAEVGVAVRARGVRDDGRRLRTTMSFGVADVDPADLAGLSPETVGPVADRLVRRADAALFAAKEAGRDRVAVVDGDGLLTRQPTGPGSAEPDDSGVDLAVVHDPDYEDPDDDGPDDDARYDAHDDPDPPELRPVRRVRPTEAVELVGPAG